MSIDHGLLFPGQGAQAVGMGKDLAEELPEARKTFAEADAILGYELSKLCLEGPMETLTRTNHAQAAIFVSSVATIRGLEAAGRFDRAAVKATAGLSLGEYTALWFAGCFSFEDGLRLVQIRGDAMQAASDAVPSGMMSLIGADREGAEKVCDLARQDGVLVVANLNAPGQVVISGDLEACGRAPAAAKEVGIRRALPLRVAGAFHSPLMEPARARLVAALDETSIEDPSLCIVSNVTAEPAPNADAIRKLLGDQVINPVLWEASMRRMAADGITSYLEPAPGTVLAGLMKKIDPGLTVSALYLAWNA